MSLPINGRTVDWETDVYARHRQVNLWPFSQVASFFLSRWPESLRSKMRVLEIGCGTGNNLWLLSSSGFTVYGCDISSSALRFAGERLASLGLNVELKQAALPNLDYAESFFDVVLDRGCLTQLHKKIVLPTVENVYRILQPGGIFVSHTLFGTGHPDIIYGKNLGSGSFDYWSGSAFARVGLTSFFSSAELRLLFSSFEEVTIERHCSYSESGKPLSEEFSVEARKSP